MPISRETAQQHDAALALLGHLVCFVNEPEKVIGMAVLVDPAGMVEVLGLTGRFAPHLFVLADAAAIAASLKARESESAGG